MSNQYEPVDEFSVHCDRLELEYSFLEVLTNIVITQNI